MSTAYLRIAGNSLCTCDASKVAPRPSHYLFPNPHPLPIYVYGPKCASIHPSIWMDRRLQFTALINMYLYKIAGVSICPKSLKQYPVIWGIQKLSVQNCPIVTFQNSPYLSFGKVFEFFVKTIEKVKLFRLKITRLGVNG